MKIVVANAMRLGSLSANAVNTMKMADAFGLLGHDVVVLCRESEEPLTDWRAVYGMQSGVRIRIIRPLFGKENDKHFYFSAAALWRTFRLKPDFVFARSYVFPLLTSFIGIPTAAESHGVGERHHLRILAAASSKKAFKCWLTISPSLAEQYRAMGAPAEKLLVLPTGASPNFCDRSGGGASLSKNGRAAAVYVGHLYDFKGIPTILDAAKLMPETDFHLVGGFEEDVLRQKAEADRGGLQNVFFHGQKTQTELPTYLRQADVLLLPPSLQHRSAGSTSPVKLGEYLAAERPIVATDIPGLRNWLTDDEVCFVTPDSGQALAAGIRRVLGDAEYRARLSRATAKKAVQFSYENRAKKILEFCFH